MTTLRPHLKRLTSSGTLIVETQPVDDVLHRFLLERAGVRGTLVRLGPAWREVAGRADYPPALHALLGEALAASALLTGNIKLDGALSIELKSSGALRLLFAESNDRGRLRGLARWNEPLPEPLALDALPDAIMAITIGNVDRDQRYQGLVDLQHAGLAESLENYFVKSEQLPARIVLAADGEHAVGLMLQKMPDEGGRDAALDIEVRAPESFGLERCTLRALVARLRAAYAGSIGFDCAHVEDQAARNWLQQVAEHGSRQPDAAARRAAGERIIEADEFERFMNRRFVGKKRFGAEGCEAMLPWFDAMLEKSATFGVEKVVIGGTARGRLNVMANIVGKPITAIFYEMKGHRPFHDDICASGDVPYHFGYTAERNCGGATLTILYCHNPSHLEAINGVAQGLGQALMEQVAYDPDSGQLLSGSFMDYAMPRADTTCDIKIVSNPVPTTLNPLGAKGAGEAGTVGALPVVVNAVLDALRPLGVKDIEMPVTSERVWRAIQAGAA